MTEATTPIDLSQMDYLKLFMQELSYQDPLHPVDNREFMAHMAQFSLLQEARATNTYLTQLLNMTSGSQCLHLLGKKIKITDREGEAQVIKITFSANTPPKISALMENGEIPEVELGQITEVRN